MKSVFHIGLIAPGYDNRAFVKAFFDNGFTSYNVFDYQRMSFEFGREQMRRILLEEASKVKPDMIFAHIQAGDILDAETWRELSKISFVVNYTFDIRSVEQSEWLYELCSIIGLVCVSNKRDAKMCKDRGYSNVLHVHSSADFEIYKQIPVSNDTDGKIAFIGNNYVGTNLEFPNAQERFDMVSRLSEKYKEDFQVYGLGWAGSKMVFGSEELAVYTNCSIAINQNNFSEPGYTSDRLWRIMGSGAFCLTSYFEGIEDIFIKGQHLDWWKSIDELEPLIEYYLSNPLRRNIVRIQGSYLVTNNYTWSNRIQQIMEHPIVQQQNDKKGNCDRVGAHVVDGIIPGVTDQQFDNRVCDCEKLLFQWTECGCAIKEYQLRATQNI
jgi:spore maturation protein CgeB